MLQILTFYDASRLTILSPFSDTTQNANLWYKFRCNQAPEVNFGLRNVTGFCSCRAKKTLYHYSPGPLNLKWKLGGKSGRALARSQDRPTVPLQEPVSS